MAARFSPQLKSFRRDYKNRFSSMENRLILKQSLNGYSGRDSFHYGIQLASMFAYYGMNFYAKHKNVVSFTHACFNIACADLFRTSFGV